MLLVVLEFEIQAKEFGQVTTAGARTHDYFVCFTDQREFGSFVLVLHLDLPPFFIDL
jgi:hypothetical protein